MGALLTWVFSWTQRRSDRRERRLTWWDKTRLKTYSKYASEVRLIRQRAVRLINDGESNHPLENEWVRDRLRAESLLLENIQFIASASVLEQATSFIVPCVMP